MGRRARVVREDHQVKGTCQEASDWGGGRGHMLLCVSGLWELEVDDKAVNWEKKQLLSDLINLIDLSDLINN